MQRTEAKLLTTPRSENFPAYATSCMPGSGTFSSSRLGRVRPSQAVWSRGTTLREAESQRVSWPCYQIERIHVSGNT